MNRGKPLERRTRLQGSTGLARTNGPARGASMERGGRLKPRSAKTADTYAREGGRRDLVAALLKANPRCQIRVACSGAPATDVDEIKARSAGGSILDPANCQTACRDCHSWKHANPAEAHRLGFTRWSWED